MSDAIMSPSIKVIYILLCTHLVFLLYDVFTIILVETFIIV